MKESVYLSGNFSQHLNNVFLLICSWWLFVPNRQSTILITSYSDESKSLIRFQFKVTIDALLCCQKVQSFHQLVMMIIACKTFKELESSCSKLNRTNYSSVLSTRSNAKIPFIVVMVCTNPDPRLIFPLPKFDVNLQKLVLSLENCFKYRVNMILVNQLQTDSGFCGILRASYKHLLQNNAW